MFVLVPVSSRNTKRARSKEGESCRQRSRSCATSARSCSLACRIFFKAEAVSLEKPPNRDPAGLDLADPQHGAELVQRQVRLLRRQGEQYRFVILQRRV